MAKKTKIHPIVFCISASVLLAGGCIMTSFPIFIFFGFAPLFALTDKADDSNMWRKMEWILFSLISYFMAIHLFDFSFAVSSMTNAIVFTLPFLGYVWTRHILGTYAGKFIIIFFWLAIEYLLLKILPSQTNFLADTLRFRPEWMLWNIHTGYLGASAWILLANLLVYQTFLSENPMRWYWIILTVLIIIGPPLYSFTLNFEPITRKELMNLYRDKSIIKDVTYLSRGEIVVRTSSIISAMILLFTLVKSQTSK